MYVNFHSKLSDEICDNFKKEFGEDISLREASYAKDGKINDLEYVCSHPLLNEYRNNIHEFLKANNCPYGFTIMADNHISIHSHEKLSDAQINEFEKQFNLNLKEFSISCNSNRIEYEFV